MKRLYTSSILLGLLTLSLPAHSLPAQDQQAKHLLRLKFKEGARHHYLLTMQQRTTLKTLAAGTWNPSSFSPRNSGDSR